jgi:hypothetical protein
VKVNVVKRNIFKDFFLEAIHSIEENKTCSQFFRLKYGDKNRTGFIGGRNDRRNHSPLEVSKLNSKKGTSDFSEMPF